MCLKLMPIPPTKLRKVKPLIWPAIKHEITNRRQPLLAIDHLCMGVVLSLDQYDATEEVAFFPLGLEKGDEIFEQLGRVIRRPGIGALIRGNDILEVRTENLGERVFSSIDFLRHDFLLLALLRCKSLFSRVN